MAKPTLKFYANSTKISKKEGLIPVYFRIIHKAKKIEGKLPFNLTKAEANTWVKDYINPESNLNLELSKYRSRFKDYIQKESQQNYSLKSAKNTVLGICNVEPHKSQFTIKSYFENYYNTCVLIDSRKRDGTKGNYNKAFDKLYQFLINKNLNETFIIDTPKSFGREFANYLISEVVSVNSKDKKAKRNQKPLSPSTAHGYLKKIKSVFYQALNEGEINYNPFFKVNITPISKKKQKLTIYQIRDIMKLDLSNKPILEKFRNCFITQFFTGCAFTDLTLIKTSNFTETISNRKKLSGVRIKTSEPYEQVCTNHLMAMIEFMKNKYNLKDSIIPKIDLTAYNESITILGELANFNFKLSSQYARLGLDQAIIDAKIDDIKAEYAIMGWSRKNEIDTKYGTITNERLYDATIKLESLFDTHLINPENGKLFLNE